MNLSFFTLGMLLIIVGFLIFAASLMLKLGSVKGSGAAVILIGLFPIVFGFRKSLLILVPILAASLFLILLFLL